MVTNSLRLDGTRWDEVKDLTRSQNQNGIKHNRTGQEKTGVFQLQIRYAYRNSQATSSDNGFVSLNGVLAAHLLGVDAGHG